MYQSIIEELNLLYSFVGNKGKQGNVIIGVVEWECIEFMRECPTWDPQVNLLHRFGARFYKNTSESLYLQIYILKLLFLST